MVKFWPLTTHTGKPTGGKNEWQVWVASSVDLPQAVGTSFSSPRHHGSRLCSWHQLEIRWTCRHQLHRRRRRRSAKRRSVQRRGTFPHIVTFSSKRVVTFFTTRNRLIFAAYKKAAAHFVHLCSGRRLCPRLWGHGFISQQRNCRLKSPFEKLSHCEEPKLDQSCLTWRVPEMNFKSSQDKI